MSDHGINVISQEALALTVTTSVRIQTARSEFLEAKVAASVELPAPVVLNTVDEAGNLRGSQMDVQA